MQQESFCVSAGVYHDRHVKGVNTPIFTSTAHGYLNEQTQFYPRYFNTVNQRAVIDKLCALEGAEDGLVFSSGMAAIGTTLLSFVKAGSHVIVQADVYGGTCDLLEGLVQDLGIEVSFITSRQPEAFEKAIKENTKLIFIESPSNPFVKLIDIQAIADISKKHGLISMIDATFASPINQTSLSLGVDIVMHSATKYLGGHSDICAGVVLASSVLIKNIHTHAYKLGGSLDAQTCYLLERSIKTLAVRIRAHNENALAVANFLQTHEKVKKVYYPGLESSEDYALAQKQMKGFGGMVAFELFEDAKEFLKRLKFIFPALSLGGVESTVCDPWSTSHAKMPCAQKEALGISKGLVRLSVGIEAKEDIIQDLAQAL